MSSDLNSPVFKYSLLTFCFFMILIFTGSIWIASNQFKKLGNIKMYKIPTKMERAISKMVQGFPIENMTGDIAKRNPKVATYLVANAKKESNWGKYSPKKNGQECYNYWGYRGSHNQTKSGYRCFDSPAHAVRVVGDRIEDLLNQKIDTPREMVILKCGSDCSVFSAGSVNKWISDVALYVHKIENS